VKICVQERQPQVYMVAVEGEIDMSTSPDLRAQLAPLFQKGTAHVIVELSGVSYIDSSGIATLVEGLQLSRRDDIRLTIAGARPSVEAVFDLAYLKGIFEMVQRIEDCLQ
jgi:anti-sigma B factor antagonist